MSEIKLEKIYKTYDGGINAVTDFNLHIEEKEFIVFVGPSGCGKSTTLRLIAGLEEISQGDLYIGDRRVNDVPPKDRDIAMVFQNYALYPHMTVYDNMAFGLKLRKFKKSEIDKRVKNAAKILGLEEMLNRKPKAMSGGQRQRVALGRAIVRDPRVFLMDEPLSNLDAKLRVQMRSEITKLHQRLQTTIIYVTHDQTEAMTMASRIVIMKDGIIQQVGTPKEVYDYPKNIFVGGFIGSPPMNFIKSLFTGQHLEIEDTIIGIPEDKIKLLRESNYTNKEVVIGIRPEAIHQGTKSDYFNTQINVIIDVAELMGAETILYSKIGNQALIAKVDAHSEFNNGQEIKLALDTTKIHLFDSESEIRIC